MESTNNKFLRLAAILTLAAALLHLLCIFVGAPGYRFLGAGEQMALMAEQGHWFPTLVTLMISAILVLWALYALSGAGIILRLPLLRYVLVVISGIFLVRAFGFVFLMSVIPENSLSFWLVSSAICLIIGGLYGLGTWKFWQQGVMKNL